VGASTRQLQPIQAGELRHTCVIEKPISVLGTGAVPSTEYVEVMSARCKIEDFRGNEVFNGQTLESTLSTYITMRYRPGIDASMRVKRIVDASQSPPVVEYFAIVAISVDASRYRGMQLACVKKDAAGFLMGTPDS
jgi:head-tail adaptor